jgi:hypothetical protein
MPKGRKGASAPAPATQAETNGHPNGNKTLLVKTTLFITDVLDANLAYMSLQTRQSKAELVRQAVEEYLDRKRYDPRKKPRLTAPTYD